VTRDVACGVRHAFRVTSDPSLYYPGTMGRRQHCASPRSAAESLTCRSSSHLLLWFESNGSHRHRRVTSLLLAESRLRRFQRTEVCGSVEGPAKSVVFAGRTQPLRVATAIRRRSYHLLLSRVRRFQRTEVCGSVEEPAKSVASAGRTRPLCVATAIRRRRYYLPQTPLRRFQRTKVCSSVEEPAKSLASAGRTRPLRAATAIRRRSYCLLRSRVRCAQRVDDTHRRVPSARPRRAAQPSA
jgi:hypothetical protein